MSIIFLRLDLVAIENLASSFLFANIKMDSVMRNIGREEWNVVNDIDTFYAHMYSYFWLCGWRAIVCREVSMYVRIVTSTTLL